MTLTDKRSDFLRRFGLFLTRIFLLDEFDTTSVNFKYILIMTHAYRSAEEQNALYQIGRTLPGKIVTNCDGYKSVSQHQRWLAVDLCIVDAASGIPIWDEAAPYPLLGEIWESFGGKWGGQFTNKDLGHFETS